jgi:hypothetical protein
MIVESVVKLKDMEATVTNQNLVHEEIKSRLNSGKAYYHSFQVLLSSCLLSINVKVNICRTTILPVFLCGKNIDWGCLRTGC